MHAKIPGAFYKIPLRLDIRMKEIGGGQYTTKPNHIPFSRLLKDWFLSQVSRLIAKVKQSGQYLDG